MEFLKSREAFYYEKCNFDLAKRLKYDIIDITLK